jgi:uncharacterized spore protein YtfJ
MPDEQPVDATLDELFAKLSSMNVMSQPIDLKDRIVIAAFKISIAFVGDAGTASKDENMSDHTRGVAGAAAGLSPVAVLDLKKTVSGQKGVQSISLNE